MNVQDIRPGVTFLTDGAPWMCLKYEHVKMGRGSATIRVKIRNLLTGSTVEKSFVNSARVEEINTARRAMQYLYRGSGTYVFMDPKSYEQVEILDSVVSDSGAYLTEGSTVNVLFWDDRPLWIELPPKIELTVAETDPGIKGNSAANMYKSAKLSNGVTIRVPLFIETGDRILVDTRDGNYVERASKS